MGLAGLLWWEAASASTARAPLTPTPTLPSRSPSCPTRPSPTILSTPIIHLHLHSSSPGTSQGGGIDGLFPWSSPSCSGQADSPRARPRFTQAPGGGVAPGQGDPSPGGLALAAVWEWTTGTVTARRRTHS